MKDDFHKQETLLDVRSKVISIPSKIGPYKIESLLSEGGMSALYLGLHPDKNEPIAIKVLLPKFLHSTSMVERFLKEAEIIRIANHPNIVKLYGQGTWENGLYIAMEFIRGVSLSQFIQKKSLSARRALEIILQVAFALSHLHAHGIIHRDLKPENILIDEHGNVKVIDFGIAQLHEEKEKSGLLMGTPVYMSPEQREHPEKVQPASDLYSLGVIAYELLLGKLSHGTIHLELLSQPLRSIIQKALEKDLHKRYSDVVDFINDVNSALQTLKQSDEYTGEMADLIQESSAFLIQKKFPSWDAVQWGLSWQEGEILTGIYVECFPLNETRFLLLIAESSESGPVSFLHGAFFRGMARCLLREIREEKLDPMGFMEQMNHELCSLQPQVSPFSCTLLLLDAAKDELVSIHCQGLSLSLIAEAADHEHNLISPNPKLGQNPHSTFTQHVENWRSGDTLLLHPLEIQSPVGDARLLSAQKCAERILEKSTKPFSRTALAICIQRIV